MNKMSTLIVSNSNGEETSFEIVDASARGDINTLTVTVDKLNEKVGEGVYDDTEIKQQVSELKRDLNELDNDAYNLNKCNFSTVSYKTVNIGIVQGEGINTSGNIVKWDNCARTELYPVKPNRKYKVTCRGLSPYVAIAYYSSDVISTNTFVDWYKDDGSLYDYEITIPDGVYGIVLSMANRNSYGNPSIKREVFSNSKIDELETKIDGVVDEFELKQLERRILNAEKGNDFAWATFDKPYFVFIQDDLNSTVADYVSVFNFKNVPICEAIIPKRVTNENIEVLRSVVSNGGEILAHYTGSPTDESTDDEWLTYTRDIKKEIESYGFEVRGIIRAGDTAYKSNKGEKYCRKYFDYANDGMGISAQYDLPRTGIWSYATIEDFKSAIDWKSTVNGIHAFGFHGISPDKDWTTPEAMGEIIDYIISKGCEIVTYSYLFDTYGSTVLLERIKSLENSVTN